MNLQRHSALLAAFVKFIMLNLQKGGIYKIRLQFLNDLHEFERQVFIF